METNVNLNDAKRRYRILWICSWFPNKLDPFDGDFILRHARAASCFHNIDVLHIVQNVQLLHAHRTNDEEWAEKGLRARIVYLKYLQYLPTRLARLVFNFTYFMRMYREINRYVEKNGKPFLVHIHIPVKAGWAGLYIKWRWNIPYIVTEHSSGYMPEIENGFYSRNAFFRFATRKILEGACVVTSVSNWLIQHMGTMFHLKKTAIIRNVVDTAIFYPSHQNTDKIRFIHVSMMRPLKNVEGILAALAMLKQTHNHWELILVGPYDETLLQCANNLALADNIQWKGLCAYEEVASAMISADVLIHFSDYENLPCVISEALCAGLFVISTQVGGISELVSTSNGVLVQKGDVVALTEAMRNYLSKTSVQAQHASNEQFRAAFNYTRIGEDFDTLYRSIKV